MTLALTGLPILFEVFWKSGAILGAALCMNLLLPKRSADVRRLILSAAILALFAAAALHPLAPHWTPSLPLWTRVETPANTVSIAVVPESFQSPPHARFTPAPVPLLWFIGTSVFLIRFALALRGLHRLRQASEPVIDAHNPANISLLQNHSIAAPVTWGLFRPVILVPTRFENLPAESRHAVLAHEQAHIQSRDFLFRSLAELARCLIWFQPLIWIALRQLRDEQELACDDRVLASGAKPSAYAKLLLEWDVRPQTASLVAVGMAHHSCLKRRLFALLDPERRRGSAGRAAVFACGLTALATALPLAGFNPTRAVIALPPIPLSHPTPPVPAPIPRASAKRVIVAMAAPQEPAPAAPLPKFIARASLVTVDAAVTDRNGNIIENLTADDFILTEDGAPQTISTFEFHKLTDTEPGVSSYYVFGYYATDHTEGRYRRIKLALKGDTSAKIDYRTGHFGDANANPNSSGPTQIVRDTATGSMISPPALIYRKDPEYSEQARKAKFSGSVTLTVDVGADGKVSKASVVRSLGMGLDEKAIEAVSQWRFRPAMKDGKAVPIRTQVEVQFRLL